jgi:integrase/recombinase XerC
MINTTGNQYNSGTAQNSLLELINNYTLDLEAINRSPKTIASYVYSLNMLVSFLESAKLTKLVRELGIRDITAFIRYLQGSKKWPNRHSTGKDYGILSPSCIQHHVRNIKVFWSWLARQGYIEYNPLASLPLPKVPQYVIRTLANSQLRKLLSSIDRSTALGRKYYCILLVLMDTGMRISELVGIKMDALDFKNGLITIFGKGQKERIVPISRQTKKELVSFMGNFRVLLCSEESPFLFPKGNGKHISVNSVQQFMRRLAKKAGLDGIRCSPHIFRHTFATQAIANEANVFTLKDIMGHASLQTTMKYTHLKVTDLKDQHNRFSPVEKLMKTAL